MRFWRGAGDQGFGYGPTRAPRIAVQGCLQGDACVPHDKTGAFSVAATPLRLRMALVHDEEAGRGRSAPGSLGDRALVSAEAPELALE